ncbi:MAG TPA: protein-L-isoaspartate O-methyltransferase [Gammaproteobacteria bacterium]|nr:protein-L-isoaspartate O-methyltransferase [Gammaproteobacteria bacterium]
MIHETARINMIKQQCRAWNVLDDDILDLFKKVPREHFVPHKFESLAFADTQIPLGHEQVMLAPKEEARILKAVNIQPNDRVLEVGTGSGFFTALLAQKAKHVDSVDIFEDFVETASKKLAELKIHNITVKTSDASLGYNKNTQYDVIILTSSVLEIPKHFLHQLSEHGRLFVFIGNSPLVEATLITHHKTEKLFETWVPPLIDAEKRQKFVF